MSARRTWTPREWRPDLVNSTKQFYSFSRSASFITHKAHLDAAGVVHGPHALHLLVHHLREPPASPKIKKDRASRKTEHQERPETERTGLAFGFSHRPSPRAQQQPRGPACRAPHLGGGAEGDDGGEHVDETDGLRLHGVAGLSFLVCQGLCVSLPPPTPTADAQYTAQKTGQCRKNGPMPRCCWML